MNSSAISSLRLLFYTLFLAYVCAGIISILPGPTLPLLAKNTGVPLDIAGWAFTASALGFALGVMLAGALSGRLGPKFLLMSGMVIMSISGAIIPWTHLFLLLLITQFILGIGFGFLDVSINMTVTLAFHDTLNETLNNLHSAYGIGALVAPLLLSLALQVSHDAILAYLVGSAVGLAGILLLTRQHVPSIPKRNEEQQQRGTSIPPGLFTQILLWLMVLEMFLYIGAELGFSTWIVTAVSQSAAISLALAAPVATVFWLGLTSGRLLGAQALRRGMLSETRLLYLCIVGGGISGLLVAFFPGQIGISFSASALVGFFFGPIFPGIMAIASRWFVRALGLVSGVLLTSAGASGMILPVFIGFLIAHVGVNWGMATPAIICLIIILPLSLALRQQRRTLHLQADEHTMKYPLPLIK